MWFCSDLDNTLIYSARREIGPEKVCVEWYEGREASYMTAFSYRKLSSLPEIVRFVPVTTRTREQYERVRFPKEPELALVCNGGVLLERGAVDETWYRESLALTAPFREAKERLRRFLLADPNRSLEVRDIAGLFLFTKSERPEETLAGLRAVLGTPGCEEASDCGGIRKNRNGASENTGFSNWILAANGQKVYAVPKVLEKGAGVVRLQKKYGAACVIAAGDSLFDRSLLAAADVAVAPEGLMKAEERKPGGKLVRVPADEILSDWMWEWVGGV